MIEVIFLYLILASVFPLGRVAVTAAAPIFFTGVRMLWAGLVLIIYFYIRYPQEFKKYIRLRYVKIWLILTIFNIYLTNVLEFWGLQTLPAAKACFIYNLSPFFAALFSYIFFGERMTQKKWIGLMIGFVGFIPILIHNTPAEKLIGGISFFSWAELALLGAAGATAFGWVIMRHSIHKENYPSVLANGMSMMLSAFLIIPTSLLFEQWNPIPISNYSYFVGTMLAITIASNFIGYNLYAFLLKKYTATFLSLAGFMSPLFAAIMGWRFLKEKVSWHFFASAAAVFIGLFIFYQEELRLGYISYTKQKREQ